MYLDKHGFPDMVRNGTELDIGRGNVAPQSVETLSRLLLAGSLTFGMTRVMFAVYDR